MEALSKKLTKIATALTKINVQLKLEAMREARREELEENKVQLDKVVDDVHAFSSDQQVEIEEAGHQVEDGGHPLSSEGGHGLPVASTDQQLCSHPSRLFPGARSVARQWQLKRGSALVTMSRNMVTHLFLHLPRRRGRIGGGRPGSVVVLERKKVHIPVESRFIRLLQAVVTWAGTTDASSVIMTASCLCTMVLDLTSEEFLLSCPGFDTMTLKSLSDLIVKSLQQDIPDDDREQFNQKNIIVSGYKQWADRFPCIKNAVEQHVYA
ncbi:hypothetical protein PR202_ga03073 [Eleusine coracana subsp. coracana]|uniref:Uncharacterized protein n=1 Tax=Eleusine coracana subsp. coracana TaxID=191504 RepID=A0AAV5BP10_ELECO|nr:hypothetical protein PR202_ga03073 [Eleusine coracana subsp. coracana]